MGRFSYERSLGLSGNVVATTGRALAARTAGPAGRVLVYNPLAWERDVLIEAPGGGWWRVDGVPATGYRVVEPRRAVRWDDPTEIVVEPDGVTLARGALRVQVDRTHGTVVQVHARGHEDGLLAEPIGTVALTRDGRFERFDAVAVRWGRDASGAFVRAERADPEGHRLTLTVRLAPLRDAVDLEWSSPGLPRPDGGVAAALATRYRVRDARPPFVHDHPYGISEIAPRGRYPRKYPTGDWMTSPQWFEQVDRPFTAYSLVDFGRDGDRGVLLLHDGSQAFGLEEDGAVRQVLSLYDPWDEDYFVAQLTVRLRLVPHQGLRHVERWRLAQEFERPAWSFVADAPAEPNERLPADQRWVGLRHVGDGPPPGVAVTAVHREDERAGAFHEGYVGRGMGHPLVVRLVEFDGVASEVDLEVAGTVAAAYLTDLLGERGRRLDVVPGGGGSRVRLSLAPYQIATVYLDVEEARKVARDLDARREVWAQVHRRDEARQEG